MILGAGTTPVGEIDGSLNHNHGFTSNGHEHPFERPGTDIAFGLDISVDTTIVQAVGTTDNESSLPPFHALLPIMEL